ncbi:hypothetical protein MPER_06590 [Moniliophthora perniciosa FA553]|nr:hypothetical protein MPER_06590 [Moniliophthora perniciosa FA553]
MCRRLKEEREKISARSGIPNALEDLWAWIDFYDAPLKNCAIASCFLKENPHEEKRTVFFVLLRHKGQSDLPVQHRFDVTTVCRFPFDQLPPGTEKNRSTAEQMGRVEQGNDYYGVQCFVVGAAFNGEMYQWPKFFSIDKETARANVLQRDWENLFCDYVEGGVKVKFCCGKLGGSLSEVCCCGGWTHDKEKLKEFVEARESRNQ